MFSGGNHLLRLGLQEYSAAVSSTMLCLVDARYKVVSVVFIDTVPTLSVQDVNSKAMSGTHLNSVEYARLLACTVFFSVLSSFIFRANVFYFTF